MAIDQYFTGDVIANRLNSQFRFMDFDPHIVEEYCARVLIEHVNDIEFMWKFEKVPLVLGSQNMALLPCNIYRIIELFDENDELLSFSKTQTHLFNIKNKEYGDDEDQYVSGDTVYITYIGVPVDTQTGKILIASGLETACETFCKMRYFEEDVMMGKISPEIWSHWVNTFPNQVSAFRSSYRHTSKDALHKMNIIRGNMLPSIGSMPLTYEEFE